MFCSLFVASWICLQPAPVVCEPILYDKKAIFTAYNLEENQTDVNPCIGAGNHNLCLEQSKGKRRICASRFLPLHTIIKIEGIGDCEILDRISLKYANRIDILFPTKDEAFKFGKKKIK